jgi:hypothetical protein
VPCGSSTGFVIDQEPSPIWDRSVRALSFSVKERATFIKARSWKPVVEK